MRDRTLEPYRALVLCGALLHDLGHGPFSHTAEDIFHTHHEDWTRRILRESEPVRSRLDSFAPTLVPQLEQVYDKTFPVPLISQLITSQLDCDRLDYLMRDSYFTGASYGHLDLDRILLALDYDYLTQSLIVARKGLAAIEHYLIVRYFMYAQVYNHPKNIAAAWGLLQAFHRAKILLAQGQLTPCDATLAAWLNYPETNLSLEDYLGADDGVFLYHLQRWCAHPDPVLADLCRRYCDRDLLKIRDISTLPESEQQDLFAKTCVQVRQLGLDPSAYVTIQVSTMRGYTLYQRGIKVMVEGCQQELSDLSPLVQSLTQPLHRAWLIYPREIGPFS
jgi:HD superfamily phosphohydrolase